MRRSIPNPGLPAKQAAHWKSHIDRGHKMAIVVA
jgi:hypothetical protein